jgi:hypothetical protein
MLRTCPDPQELQQLLLGRLPDNDAESLEQHLLTCSSCLQTVRGLRPASDTLVDAVRDQTAADRPDRSPIADLMGRLKGLHPPAVAETQPMPPPASAVVAGLVEEQRRRWQQGERILVEAFLERQPELRDNTEAVLDLIYNEFLRREERGEKPQLADYVQRFPHLAGPLQMQFAVDRALTPSGEDGYDFLAPPQGPDEIGRLGSYRIVKTLGAGGMGIVFEAQDLQLKRAVALKVMRPLLAASPSSRRRFLREAETTAALEHDHIVTIHQVGEDRGIPFLAMKLLRGESLEARLQREGRLPLHEVLRIGREVAEGLAAAHEHGLIHRDIKPSNVWLEAPPLTPRPPLPPRGEGEPDQFPPLPSVRANGNNCGGKFVTCRW